MPLLTVEGEYKDGTVKLSEPPSGVQAARVLVTFLPGEDHSKVMQEGQQIHFGMFGKESGHQTTWEDFTQAKRAMYKHIGENDDQARD